MTDTKLSALTDATSVALTDKLTFTTDPSGTPATKNGTLTILRDALRSFSANKVTSTTATGTVTLTDASNDIQLIDPGVAARDVTLPAEAATNHAFMIANTADADELLTVKNDGGTVIALVSRGKTALIVSSGSQWVLTTNSGYKQLWIGGWKPTLTSGCAYPTQIEMGTNKNVYDYLAFDASTIEYAYANAPMPSDYSGGEVYACFYWTHPATTTNFKVSHGLSAAAVADDGTLDVAQGTPQYSNDTGGTTSDLYISPLTSAITIAGTPTAGKFVNWRASRKADDATNDTLAVDAYLLGVMIWYPVA